MPFEIPGIEEAVGALRSAEWWQELFAGESGAFDTQNFDDQSGTEVANAKAYSEGVPLGEEFDDALNKYFDVALEELRTPTSVELQNAEALRDYLGYLGDNLERRIEALNAMESAIKNPEARQFFESVFAPTREEDRVLLAQINQYVRREDCIPPNMRMAELLRFLHTLNEQRLG